jgi:hypothetical protein
MVRVAAEEQIDDAGARTAFLGAYTGRLLRSDLAAHMTAALARRDPSVAALFGSIEGFIAALPPAWIHATDGLARDIVEPPLRRWERVPRPARPAFWSLAERAAALDPDLPAHGASPVARLGLRLVLRRRTGMRPAGILVLRLARLVTGVRRRLPFRWAA